MGQDPEHPDLRKPSYSEWRGESALFTQKVTELSPSDLMTATTETFRERQIQHTEISLRLKAHFVEVSASALPWVFLQLQEKKQTNTRSEQKSTH